MTFDLQRSNDRSLNQLRDISFERHYLDFAEGSCLVCFGRTKVLCSASVGDSVPPFLLGAGQGWLTAEYAMLPKSSHDRIARDRNRGGRAQEIQRLIGRSLRSIVNLEGIGERTIHIDCDVIQADGGTRTAAITGAAIALHDACSFMQSNGLVSAWPMKSLLAAVSIGLVDGQVCLDLDYREDSVADVDMNVVKTEAGQYVEIQGTAEQQDFSRDQLNHMLDIADQGMDELFRLQRKALGI